MGSLVIAVTLMVFAGFFTASIVTGLRESELPQPVTCGPFIQDNVFAGERTQITDYPWMALLQFEETKNPDSNSNAERNKFQTHCGGVLIHQYYVLTAAHCFVGKNVTQNGWKVTSVRLGEWDWNKEIDKQEDLVADPPVDIDIAEIIVHKGYRNTSLNRKDDIALIRLVRPTQFTYFIKPLCLPNVSNFSGAYFDNETTFVAAGWGAIGNYSTVKLQAQLNGFSFKECREKYLNRTINLTDKQICAGGEPGKDVCRGDSGGPLMKMDLTNRDKPFMFLAGIVSFGMDECGQLGWPSVFTRVDKYMDWILENMRP